MDAWALAVAVLALVVSVIFSVRQEALQRRLAAIEVDRRGEEVALRLQADVTARFESYISTAGHRNYQLVLINAGLARAEGVTVELVGPIEGNAPDLMMKGHSFPIALDPRQEYTIAAAVVMGLRPRSTRFCDGRTGPVRARRRSL